MSLGLEVYDLRIHGVRPIGPLSFEQTRLSSELFEKFKAILVGVAPAGEEMLMRLQSSWESDHSLKYVVLSTLCADIETLHIACGTEDCDWFLNLFSPREHLHSDGDGQLAIGAHTEINSSVRPFHGLISLTYQCLDLEIYEEFWLFKDVWLLTLLSEIHLDQFCLETSVPSVTDSIRFNLVEIYFTNSIWTVDGVRDLLIVSPQLKLLELQCKRHQMEEDEGCELDFPRLGDILRQHGTNLTHLTIDARGSIDYGDQEAGYMPLIGNLKSLTCLRKLCIPLVQLLDISAENSNSYFSRPIQFGIYCDLPLSMKLREEILPSSIKIVHLLNHGSPISKSSILLEYQS